MKLICTQCGDIFKSVIIDKELAWNDILKSSSLHVKKKHPELFESIAKAVMIVSANASTYLHCTTAMLVTEDEEYIQEKLKICQETTMMSIGFDSEEDEDDELEDEEEEDDNLVEMPEPIEDNKPNVEVS